jgi:8-oxo-dGTP pyrophosphatase MutT (NUDIX family)
LLHFDPQREPPLPRDAATVVVLRDSPAGVEVFCVRRSSQSSFLGGALVFPGGKVDAPDAAPEWESLSGALPARAEELAGSGASARALLVAACRETLEEAALLRTTRRLDAEEALALQRQIVDTGDMASVVRRNNLTLALDAFVPWSRWVTPEAESRRYDARFYLLPLPEGQVGHHDQRETTMSVWARPLDVLDWAARGEVFLAPPTTRTLELLGGTKTVEEARALATRQSLRQICPQFVPADETGAPFLALPGDPAHSIRERRIDGPSRFVLRDGRFVSADAADRPTV